MSLATTLSAYARFTWAQRQGAPARRDAQERRLRRLMQHAYRTVPFYRARFDEAGEDPDRIRSLEDLPRLPVVSKSDLQEAGAQAITSQAYPPDSLVPQNTTGSSGRPLTLRVDRRWLSVRRALFARALWAAGYRPGHTILMLTEEMRGLPRFLGVRNVPFDASPPDVTEHLRRLRPHVLYGWMSPLRRLACYLDERAEEIPALNAVVTTAETLDSSTRTMLQKAFRAPVFDLYGLTEMGMIGWECAAHQGFHIAEDAVIAEYLPTERHGIAHRLVLTNLEQFGTPFLRYDTGDLVEPARAEACNCGLTFARLTRIDGRSADCLRLRDGRVVLPYELTLHLERVAGLNRYRIVQQDWDRCIVQYESAPGDDGRTPARTAQRAVERVLGADVRVQVERRASLDPPPGCKFRVVECCLPAGAALQ